MKKIEVGSRVHISTHGKNVGTVIQIIKSIFGFDAIVKMDTEPAARRCRTDIPDNVTLCI